MRDFTRISLMLYFHRKRMSNSFPPSCINRLLPSKKDARFHSDILHRSFMIIRKRCLILFRHPVSIVCNYFPFTRRTLKLARACTVSVRVSFATRFVTVMTFVAGSHENPLVASVSKHTQRSLVMALSLRSGRVVLRVFDT